MKDSEPKFHRIFECMMDGVLIASHKTRRFLMACPAKCRMTEYTAFEFCSLSIEDIHPPESLPEIRETLNQMSEGKEQSRMCAPRQAERRIGFLCRYPYCPCRSRGPEAADGYLARRLRPLQYGFQASLGKPYQRHEMAEVLARVLKERSV